VTHQPVPAAAPERLSRDESEAVRAAIAQVVSDGPWIGGPVLERFESEYARASGSAHVVGVANGTDALMLAMLALDLPAGSDVLVAANEGGYAAAAARAIGLRPVVTDVGESMSIGVPEAEAALTPETAAIVVTHLHGEAAPLSDLDGWRRRHGLALIEDCAQAHGARSGGRPVGTTGDAAAYSFYPTKNLGAIGDAGAVATDDPARAERVRRLRQYGWDDRRRITIPGGRNSRMDPLQAAVLAARLPWLESRNERRRLIANRYRQAVAGSAIRIHGDERETVAHHAVALTERRDDLAAFLGERGIAVAVHYPYLLGDMPGLLLEPRAVPVAERFRDTMLSLPCFPELNDDEVDRVVSALTDWIAHG
jgi:dTDP-4-amino-4,6-dideoxygalactose transaminase